MFISPEDNSNLLILKVIVTLAKCALVTVDTPSNVPFAPVVPLLGLCPKVIETKTDLSCKKKIFLSALFVIAKKLETNEVSNDWEMVEWYCI